MNDFFKVFLKEVMALVLLTLSTTTIAMLGKYVFEGRIALSPYETCLLTFLCVAVFYLWTTREMVKELLEIVEQQERFIKKINEALKNDTF